MDEIDQATVVGFFYGFVEAFATFEGSEIARRYLSPYLAMHTSGAADCFAAEPEVARYFQSVLDEYYAQGCRSCRYRDLEAVSLGSNCVLGTVTWELLHEDGQVLGCWRESYNLFRTKGGLKVFASVDHA